MNIDKVIKKESDKKLFHLLYRMPEDNSLFYTDDISYIVGIHKNLSWIWTKENISLENIKEIVKILKNKNIKEITCKNELYITIRKLLEIKNINKINFYECTNINNKKRVGTISKITILDYNSSLNIELQPVIDFARLENVIVVNQKELNDRK